MNQLLRIWPEVPTSMLWGSMAGRGSVLRLVRLTVGFCSLNFSLVAYLLLFSADVSDVPVLQGWVIGIATANLIPTVMWFSGKIKGKKALELYGLWADLGTASILLTLTSYETMLFSAVLFVTTGAYFTFLLHYRWLVFHLIFTTALILTAAVFHLANGIYPTTVVLVRTNVVLCAVVFIPVTVQFVWQKLLTHATASKVDALTGLLNRRGLSDMSEYVWSTASAHRADLAVAVVDIDKFKAVNDTYGHEIGDTVIVRIGTRLQEHVNGVGYVARTGGEEFTVAVIGTTAGLRKRIAAFPRAVVTNSDNPVATISVGAVTIPFTADRKQFDYNEFSRAVIDADHLMYDAKSAGGNTCAHFIPMTVPRTQPPAGRT